MIAAAIDSSALTGRRPPKRLPRFMLTLGTPWFYIHVGHLWDAYGLTLSWGRIAAEELNEGASVYRRSKTWAWWTAEEIIRAGGHP